MIACLSWESRKTRIGQSQQSLSWDDAKDQIYRPLTFDVPVYAEACAHFALLDGRAGQARTRQAAISRVCFFVAKVGLDVQCSTVQLLNLSRALCALLMM